MIDLLNKSKMFIIQESRVFSFIFIIVIQTMSWRLCFFLHVPHSHEWVFRLNITISSSKKIASQHEVVILQNASIHW